MRLECKNRDAEMKYLATTWREAAAPGCDEKS
jgi:hypothetical protein